MLEEQLAFYLDKYLGEYVKGLSKEALKVSVWNGPSLSSTSLPLLPLFSLGWSPCGR
jgi:vacuolar protein sorting-associated protein 13A/C